METKSDQTMARAEAFGREFGTLMKRLNKKYAASLAEPGARREHARMRTDIATEFEQEVEDLISEHHVADPVAEYVRHVVREGFDVAFDVMDPTEEALRAGKAPPGRGGLQ